MHEHITHIASGWTLVRFCTKPCECHLMQVNAKWTDSIQENIQSKIVL